MISFGSAALGDDLVSYFKLDGTSGAVIDAVGFDNGINGGALRGQPGLINNSFQFNGSNTDVDSFTLFEEDWTAYTWSVWVNATQLTGDAFVLFSEESTSQNVRTLNMDTTAGRMVASTRAGAGAITIVNTTYATTQAWSFFTVTAQESGNISLYLDGVLVDTAIIIGGVFGDTNGDAQMGAANAGQFWNGSLDEVGIWNRSLDASEVLELYNGGSGLAFPFGGQVSLNIPSNASTVSGNVTFNATIIPPIDFNITNATIVIFNSSQDLVFSQTNTVTGNETNSTSFLVTNLTQDNYEWNVFSDTMNSTDTITLSSSTNFTFTWNPFQVDAQSFNSDVFETSFQEYFLNITTTEDILSVDSILNYNSTRFTAITSCTGTVCQISTAIDVPLVIVGSQEQNKTFLWELTLFDGVTSFSTNTTLNEQNVSRTFLEQCNATFPDETLNFTAFDEANLTPIDFTFDGTFDFWLGTGSVKRNNSISNSSASSLQMCLQPSLETFMLDANIAYDEDAGTNYTARNYFFQNNTINNVSQDIGLGLLLAEDSTSFILKVQDRDILPVPGVLIFTQRFYPGEGIFRTVQVAQTDDNGATIGFFKTETIDYRFIIVSQGTTLLVTNQQKIVGEEVPFTLTFTVGEDEGAAWIPFENPPELTSSLLFNTTTQVVTFNYLDTSNNFTSSRLIVERINASALSNDIVCDTSSTQSSATLSCNMTGNATSSYIARASINRDGTSFLVEQITFSITDFSSVSGLLGLFLGFFIILICAFFFKFNEIAGILMVNVGVIFVNLIGLINFGYGFISAIIAISVIILVVLER